MVLPADLPLIAEGLDFGGFRLHRELGRGGMAVVFEAEEFALRRRVALKVFHPRLNHSADDGERFLREAEAAGRLTHPAAVRVFGRGMIRGVPYIVSELVPGARDLESVWAEWSTQPRSIPRDQVRCVARWIAEVADAVAEAHARGVLHRDLKPANLLLDEQGRVRLVDFGLASIRDRVGLSRSGEMSGTPYYMCPEQVRSGSFSRDGRCDIYSLGATLYQLLTLRRPVEGVSPEQVFHAILNQDPVHPRKIRPQLPSELVQVCLKAMEKDPRQRYASMADFAEDLHRFLRHESVLAQPPSTWRRVRTWLQRHPRSAVGLVLGLVSIGPLAYGADRLAGAESAQRESELAWSESQDQRHAILTRAAGRAVAGFRFGDARELIALTETERADWTTRHLRQRMERPLVTLQEPGGPRLLGAAIHPDGRFVAAGFGDGSLRWWNALSGRDAQELDHFDYGVFGVAFSPHGHYLAAGGDDTVVRIYDTESLRVTREYQEHEYGVGWVSFSPDGQRVATLDDGGEVHIWDPSTGATDFIVQVEPRAIVLAFTHDGAEFAVADGIDKIHRFDAKTGERIGEELLCHDAMVFDLEYSADGSLWSASLDGTICQTRWGADQRARSNLRWQGDSAIQTLAPGLDGTGWWFGCKDGWISSMDRDGQVHREFQAHFAFTNVIELDPRGRYLLSGGDDGAVQLWRPQAAPGVWKRQAAGPIAAAEFVEQGNVLLLRLANGDAEVWDLLKLQRVEGSPWSKRAAALTPAARAGEAWKRAAIESVHPIEGLRAHASPVNGEVEIEGSTGTAVLLELGSLDSELLDLSFVPGADGLAAVSADGSLRFWGTSLSQWPLRYD